MFALAAAAQLAVAKAYRLDKCICDINNKHMRLLILYRPNSEHARLTEDFISNFQRTYTSGIEVQDVDSREGIATIVLYDIMQYPAILALAPDGAAQKVWQGGQLPLLDEVASYAAH
jgi:hypothetical protein